MLDKKLYSPIRFRESKEDELKIVSVEFIDEAGDIDFEKVKEEDFRGVIAHAPLKFKVIFDFNGKKFTENWIGQASGVVHGYIEDNEDGFYGNRRFIDYDYIDWDFCNKLEFDESFDDEDDEWIDYCDNHAKEVSYKVQDAVKKLMKDDIYKAKQFNESKENELIITNYKMIEEKVIDGNEDASIIDGECTFAFDLAINGKDVTDCKVTFWTYGKAENVEVTEDEGRYFCDYLLWDNKENFDLQLKEFDIPEDKLDIEEVAYIEENLEEAFRDKLPAEFYGVSKEKFDETGKKTEL